MDGSMFNGVFETLIIFGIIIGLCLGGLGWFIYWLLHHIAISWV